MYRVLVAAIVLVVVQPSRLHAGQRPAPQPQAPFALWDAKESIEHYAQRVNLPPTKTLDLGVGRTVSSPYGSGVTLELVLIPAGKFVMGTPEPVPVDEDGFRKTIVVGQAAFAVGVAVLLVLIATVIIRAIRQRHRPQYSLARLLAMTVVAGVAVLGEMHWWFSTRALAQAQADYSAALAHYRSSHEWDKPAQDVTLTKPSYMSKYEITQEQYQQLMGANPSEFKGPNLPVEQVSWDEATAFCKKVAQASGLRRNPEDCATVRLPTEAEWEFACRAGTTTTYYTGDTEADLGRAAWYSANSGGKTHPVGQKAANAWGLHDMHGNIWEWCQDYWQEQYEPEATVDPQGPSEGQHRALRSGAWLDAAGRCRSARRTRGLPDDRYYYIGFRVVLAPRTP